MNPTQLATIAAVDHVLAAPKEHIAKEPPLCLIEILDVLIEHLTALLPHVGLGWSLVELEILKGRAEKRLTGNMAR